jgi:hypothetical protein
MSRESIREISDARRRLADRDRRAPGAPGLCVQQRNRRDRAKPPGTPGAQAEGKRWYVNSEPITFNATSYVKFGLPRQLALFEIEVIGEKEGVPIAAEAGNPDREVLYILASAADCSFQPYQKGG